MSVRIKNEAELVAVGVRMDWCWEERGKRTGWLLKGGG